MKKKVISGNWGCGVFNGTPEIKFILQWLACSQAGRDLVYTTFGNAKLKTNMARLAEKMKDKTVGDIAKILFSLEGNTDLTNAAKFLEYFESVLGSN